jgi:nitrogen fixation/metabolism regulation signal transduction histidine kinase
VLAMGLAGVLLLALSAATRNTQFFTDYYPVLLWSAVGLGVVLLVLLVELLRRLISRLRRGLFGSRLMARMAVIFVVLAVAPAALMFFVSVQFIERSVESWFDVPVERALDSGLSLARVSLDSRLQGLLQDAKQSTQQLDPNGSPSLAAQLERLRVRLGASELQLLNASGKLLASASETMLSLAPATTSAALLRQAKSQGQWSAIEGSDGGYRLRVLVPWEPALGGLEPGWLSAMAPVPLSLAELAEVAQQGWRDYQELSISRATLKRLFRITLVMVFLLTIFAAVAAAFLLAGWLVGPLAELAKATRVLASGQFIEVKDYAARDELGVLMQSFNRMSRGLHDAQQTIGQNQLALQTVNLRLQSVLSHIDAAVFVFDAAMRLESANAQAEKIWGQSLAGCTGWPLLQLPGQPELGQAIHQAFADQPEDEALSWQRQWTLRHDAQVVLARGAKLGGERAGYVVVLDDITQVLSGERALAWAEVAQRLAHEIKNPLTPIQLSAERLQRKLRPALTGPEAELVEKTAQTIVSQVDALKSLVDQLRDYSRLASTQMEAQSLNDVVSEVASLYGRDVRLELDPQGGLIRADRLQIRQVLHNLTKNALESQQERQLEGSQVLKPIVISTKALKLADGRNGLRLRVRDHGAGFSEAMLARIFEPYVTTKRSGSGLGLAIVRKIVEEHGAQVEVSNWSSDVSGIGGAQVSVVFPMAANPVLPS